MGEPSTSSGPVSKETECDSENIGSETNKLLQRIIWKIKQEEISTLSTTLTKDVVSRTASYTGIHENVITKMLVNGKPPVIESRDILIDRRIIQDSLIDTYLKKMRVPTVTQLFNAVEYILPCYVDVDTFKIILIKMGYVFHMYDEHNTFYVMEKKSVTFERYKYLKAIQQCREDNTPIYYIGVASISNAQEILNSERSLQTDSSDIVQHVLFTANEEKVQYIKIVTTISYDVLKMWLISHVLPDLPLQSVCVLDDTNISRKTLIDVPTLNSLKVDMVEWLEYHNIPCDLNMPKSELLTLIETCTNTNDNYYAIDNIVKTYNQKLLRLPECINGLSIAAQVIKFLNKKVILKGSTNTTLCNMTEEQLNMSSDCVQKEELRLLQEDLKVDNILDKVVANTRNTAVNEDDFFFDYSDSD